MRCPGAGGISIRSLSGTCVLTTAGQQPSATITVNLSGAAGTVVACSGGAPISFNLPHGQGGPLLLPALVEGACSFATFAEEAATLPFFDTSCPFVHVGLYSALCSHMQRQQSSRER